MMGQVTDRPVDTFIQVAEVWVPQGDRRVLASGSFGDLGDFAAAAHSFSKGAGLPGKAWAEARPVVLKS